MKKNTISINRRPWHGAWIGLDWQADCWPTAEHHVTFRKDIALPSMPRAALLRICAFANYALWINGRFTAYGPSRAFPAESLYDTIDISPHLKRGRNAIALLVDGPTGATGYSIVTRMGLLIDGLITMERGILPVKTDITWMARPADWFIRTGLLSSLPTNFQEHVDGRKEPRNWRTARPDKTWKPAWFIGPANVPPWRTLAPRSIPQLVESKYRAPLVWRGHGSGVLTDVRDNLLYPFNAMRLHGHPVPAAASGQWIDLRAGDVVAFDFGRTRFVRPSFATRNCKETMRFECYYEHGLEKRPTCMDSFNCRQAGFVDSFTPPTGHGYWEALNPRGFRFMTVRCAGRGHGQIQLKARTVDYPFQNKAHFQSGNELLNTIWRISANTLRSSTTDIIADCCSRENRVWAFDTCVSAKAAYYTFGETAMWRRCLILLAQAVQPDGDVFAMAPISESFDRLYDQSMYWAISCRDYLLATGDLQCAREVAPAITRFLTLLSRHMTSEGLFVPPDHAWHWIDWAPVNKRPYSLAANAMLGYTAQAARFIATFAHDRQLAKIATEIDTRIGRAIPRFYDTRRKAFRSRIDPRVKLPPFNQPADWPGIPLSKPQAFDLHGNALVWHAGYGTKLQHQAAAEFINATCLRPWGPHNLFGPGWTDLILSPLFATGHAQTAMMFIESMYGPFIRNNSPTWGEGFHGNPFNSAHGWGASVNSLIVERLIGLRPSMPGWRRHTHTPSELAAGCAYSLTTPSGNIRVTG